MSARVILTGENFHALVRGEIVKTKATTGAICPKEIPVEIILQDIGFAEMTRLIAEAAHGS